MNILFAGTPEFAAGYLKDLLQSDHNIVAAITQPDKPGRRGKKLIPSPVKLVAQTAGIPVIQPSRLKLADISEIECDLMIVVAYGQILKPNLLAYPKFGCLNVHASLLPRWRGAAPVQRAILAGDTQTGITLMQMDEGLDTGDMLATARLTIERTDTTASLITRMGSIGHPLLRSTLAAVQEETLLPVSQDDSLSTYAAKISKDEAQINWLAAAIDVDRSVRAYNPDPIAFTFIDEHRVRVHEGTPENVKADPGQVVEVSKSGILIGCGENSFRISRLQLPFGKGSILSGADILNGWTDFINETVSFSVNYQ